jgi:RNA polymerase sigma-70 factor (ECF subfamily)
LETPDEKRFLRLIAANRPRILKISRIYTRSPSDQDDLYQETLFQLWRALPNLREDAYADTWLYRIALNTAIGFVRKDKSRRTAFVSGNDQSLHEIPDTQPLPGPSSEDRFSQLSSAIAQLNDAEKAVITLFLEDLTYAQMAEVLGVSENHVGVMLHRAKKKLSTLMKEAACTMTS